MNYYIGILNSIEQYWIIAGAAVLLLLVLILLIALILTSRRVKKLEKKLNAFTSGSDGASLEKEIKKVISDNADFRAELSSHKDNIDDLYSGLKRAVQKVALVKYDAFKEMGGKLSSVSVFLDGNDDGVLLNTVHSNSGSYTYSKRIRQGSCTADLGSEEKAALEKAMRKDSGEGSNGVKDEGS